MTILATVLFDHPLWLMFGCLGAIAAVTVLPVWFGEG